MPYFLPFVNELFFCFDLKFNSQPQHKCLIDSNNTNTSPLSLSLFRSIDFELSTDTTEESSTDEVNSNESTTFDSSGGVSNAIEDSNNNNSNSVANLNVNLSADNSRQHCKSHAHANRTKSQKKVLAKCSSQGLTR